jgi:excisionase family DNA binding protein
MDMLQEKERMFTAKEAGARLGVTDARIRQLLLDGVIQGRKIGNLMWLIPESEIEKYSRSRRPPGWPRRQL